jgi:hypothetical protein
MASNTILYVKTSAQIFVGLVYSIRSKIVILTSLLQKSKISDPLTNIKTVISLSIKIKTRFHLDQNIDHVFYMQEQLLNNFYDLPKKIS